MQLQPGLNMLAAGGPLLSGSALSTSFTSQWTTDNLGTSADDQVTLPLVASGTYNFVVNWGDGSSDDTITVFSDPAATHTFIGGAGTFTVTITGVLNGWQFNGAGDNQKIIQISNWGDFQPGTNLGAHFLGCANLVIPATDAMNTTGVLNMRNMFSGCSSMTSLDASGFDTSSVNTMVRMFDNCTSLVTLDITGFVVTSVLDANNMFGGCGQLAALDLSNFVPSSVTSFDGMFINCSSLVTLDLSSFVTTNANSMASMFNGCSGLTSLDVTSLDTSGVTSMLLMFNGCSSVTSLDVTGFVTSIVTTMKDMFNSCSQLSALDVAGFDTSSLTTTDSMFSGCSGVTALDVSGFDTSGVSNMAFMFNGCSGVTVLDMDTASWDIGLVTTMFGLCNGVTLNTSNYDDILAAWAAQTVQSTVNCSFGSSQYTIATAQADRDILTDPPNSWTLSDGGGV